LVIGPLAACGDVEIQAPDWPGDGDLFGEVKNTNFSAEASFAYTLAAAPTLSLSGVAGSVEIVGSSSSTSVVVEGVRRVRSESSADADRHLADLQVDLWESDGTLFVETRRPSVNRGRAYEVDYRITVPEGTNLRIKQASGPVEVRSVQGDVDIALAAGGVTLESLAANVRTTVMAGEIQASLAVPAGGHVELLSTTGNISLSIPAATSASLRAITTTGDVQLVGLSLDDEDSRRSVFRGTMGGGNGTIRLETVAGDITINGTGG
jgi:hypothetical protein